VSSALSPTNRVVMPLYITESGSSLIGGFSPSVIVWTGTSADGTSNPAIRCSDWTSTAANGLIGFASAGPGNWSSGSTACTGSARFYCLGTDFNRTLTWTLGSGRTAFLSTAWNIAASPGLAGADALCQSEASAAGLSGTYRALLGTSTASAASRFSATGANWYRRDGIAVAATPTDLLQGRILAPIAVTAAGVYINGITRTGMGGTTPSPSVTSTSTCSDWTNGTSATSSIVGEASDVVRAFGTGGSGCNFTWPVYCLQQ